MSNNKCPVMHGGATESSMSNSSWWPEALNLDICSGPIEPDTLMRDNNCQSIRCHDESKTNLQAVPKRV